MLLAYRQDARTTWIGNNCLRAISLNSSSWSEGLWREGGTPTIGASKPGLRRANSAIGRCQECVRGSHEHRKANFYGVFKLAFPA